MLRLSLLAATAGAASAVNPPTAGSLFCGGIPGILKSNLTVKSATVMDYVNDITIANIVVNCPGEAYSYDASTGVLDISKDMADPNNCFAKASAKDGGSTFTFTYNGADTIASKNSKWGSIDLKKASGATCSSSLASPRVAPPPAGALFCGGIPGILKSNLTVKSATVMDYVNDITIANIVVDCPGEAYSYDASTGVLDISKDMADPNNCFAKASAKDGGSTFTFTYNGADTIASKNSKWGSIDLKKASGATCK